MANELKEKDVIKALESPKYRWRTVRGIAKEAKLSESVVITTVNSLRQAGKVVRSQVPSDTGEELFTTRKRFRESAPLSERLLAALRNRST